MMRLIVVLLCIFLSVGNSHGQITITAADMPVHGDSLAYSSASPLSTLTFAADSGAGMTWNYALTATSHGVDVYKTPAEINPFFGFTISYHSSYGYKIADSIPGIGFVASGISISNLHTFYNKFTTPSSYVALAFGAMISGLPVGADYTQPDHIYHFPLSYNNYDSTDFYLNYGAASFGGIKQKGYRKTHVDGWGTITTPYFTTPQECIRVRSEIVEVDSISLDTLSFALPRTTIEYKWLVKGEHYPALFVTALSVGGAEVVTGVKYRDAYQPGPSTGTNTMSGKKESLFAYPNPATAANLMFEIPGSWSDFTIELFNATGSLVGTAQNSRQIDVSALPSGNYIARITSAGTTAYIKVVR